MRVGKSRSLVLVLVLAATGVARAAAPQETLRFTVAKSLLQSGLESAINETTKVSGTLMDSTLSGTAITTGNLTLDLIPGETAAGVMLSLATETEARTVGVNRPRYDIAVSLTSSVHTTMTSSKSFFFAPAGVATEPAVSRAKSSIYYEGLEVKATGPLPQTTKVSTEKEAWDRAAALKSVSEEETAQKAAREMNARLDTDADKRLGSFNRIYNLIFYKPIFLDSAGTRSLHFSSTADALSARIDSVPPHTLTPPPAFDGGNVLAMRIHESLASSYFSEAVDKKRYNEEDLEEFLIMHGVPSGLARYHGGEAQIGLDLCVDKPIAVSFRTLQLELALCVRQLEFKGVKSQSLRMLFSYASKVTPEGNLELWRLNEPEVAPELEGASGFSPEAAKEIKKRLGRIFPEQLAVPKIRLPGKFGAPGELTVHRADLGDGWLVEELWFDPSRKTKK